MVAKQIRVAVWEYENAEGKRRKGYFGDVVDMPESEVRRGEKAGVFDQPEPDEQAIPFTLPTGVAGPALVPEAEAGGLDDEPADDEARHVDDDSDDDNDPADDEPGDAAGKPKRTAPVVEWREYVVHAGIMSEAEAADMSRADLIKRAG